MDSKVLPKISIVTPSYNQGEFLEDAILSVLNQDYPVLEYIIIDGGSNDNSVEIIKKYEEHLHYWISEPDDGQYHAINKGFSMASGDVFAWLNSSDFYLPWTLKTVGNVFSELPEVNWLTTLNKLVFSEDGYCVNNSQVPAYSKRAFLDGCHLPVWPRNLGWIQQESTFWRRSLWETANGLSLDYQYAADFDLWCRLFDIAHLYGVASPLAGHRYHAEQLSQLGNKYKKEAEMILADALIKKNLPKLDQKLKMTSENKIYSWFINTAIEYRNKKHIGPVLETLRDILISTKKKEYSGDIVQKCDDDNYKEWKVKAVKYSL